MIPIRDTLPRRSTPVATYFLILVNAIVFLFELTMAPDQLEQFIQMFGLVPARALHSGVRYWPFLTSMFLHAGWVHIIGNMWTLWIFGAKIEDRMGPARYVIFYLLCGFIAGLVHCLTNAASTVPTLGASGAIAGVMGAYFFLFPTSRIVVLVPIFFYPLFFELPAVVYLGLWALSQLFSGTLALASGMQVGGVAWWAHVGGFTAGIVFQFFFVRRGPGYRPVPRDEYGAAAAWPPNRYRRQSR